MKFLMFSGALALLVPQISFAATSDVHALLAGYSSTDLNHKCSVELQGNVLKIRRSTAETKEMRVKISNSKNLGSGVLELSDDDYTGKSDVFLIQKESSLLVLATWDDNDNSLDQASFCELEKK